jgi:hypothetical protein
MTSSCGSTCSASAWAVQNGSRAPDSAAVALGALDIRSAEYILKHTYLSFFIT